MRTFECLRLLSSDLNKMEELNIHPVWDEYVLYGYCASSSMFRPIIASALMDCIALQVRAQIKIQEFQFK